MFKFLYKNNLRKEEESFLSNCIRYFLINSKDDKIEEKKKEIVNEYKSTFACYAAYTVTENEFVEFMEKFDVDINSAEPNYSMTPLIFSAMNDDYDTLKIILEKYKNTIDVNCKNINNISTLHVLCCKPDLHQESAKILLSFKNLNINEQDDQYLYTPLHLAVIHKNTHLISLLLGRPDIRVDILDDLKNSPYHYIFNGQMILDILKLFYNYSDKDFDLSKKNSNVYLF